MRHSFTPWAAKALLTTISAVLTLALPALPALAAELREVIVTATRREESIRDVPISMMAATGVRGGGFNARYLTNENLDPTLAPGFDTCGYREEEATNFELGFKSALLNGAMNMNATIVHMEIDDLQVSIFDGATVFLDNEFKEFTNSPCWSSEAAADSGGCLNSKDVSWQPNQFSPDVSANLKFDYFRPIGSSLEYRSTLNVNCSDGYFTAADLNPVYAIHDNWTKIGLRLALTGGSDHWEHAVVGKNLTDEETSGNNNEQPLVPGNGFSSLDRSRSWAVQRTYRF